MDVVGICSVPLWRTSRFDRVDIQRAHRHSDLRCGAILNTGQLGQIRSRSETWAVLQRTGVKKCSIAFA